MIIVLLFSAYLNLYEYFFENCFEEVFLFRKEVLCDL